jgi:predicted nucleotidyltransferase
MNIDKWFMNNVVYVTLHGSQAYGLNNSLSDVDVKGICVPPREVEDDLFENFEQAENHPLVEMQLGHLKNPLNPIFESSIYSLRKFFLLAANSNPNIIELLWTDESDHFVSKPLMKKILAGRDRFLSSKAKFTFSGYAFAQAAKIERHRKWIVQGELVAPTREDFKLPEVMNPGVNEVFGYIKSQVESWNLNQYPLDEQDRSDLKETIWDLVRNLGDKKVSWDNWPNAYSNAAINKLSDSLSLKEEVVVLLQREREYDKACNNYKSWLRWKKERNPARLALEIKSGYDTKHASHLVRLMRMGYEIMTDGNIIVKRPDREELLAIKNGAWSYEKVMEFAADMQVKLDESYKTTTIKKKVDNAALNSWYHDLVEEYHS